jgi:hypothetical protein
MELQQLFSVQTLFLSLAIGVIMQLLKGWVEIKWPQLPDSKNWSHAYLPTLSIIIGMSLSLFSTIVPGFLINGTLTDHLLNGICCGFFSSYIWRGVASFLTKELDLPPSNFPDINNIPPSPKVPNFPENKNN